MQFLRATVAELAADATVRVFRLREYPASA